MTTRTLLAYVCTIPLLAACGGEGDAPQEGELGVSADEARNDRASTEASGAEQAGPRTIGEGDPGGDATFENRDAPSAFSREILPLEARGDEPGWLLNVTESSLELEYDYGEQTLTADTVETSEMENGLRIAAPEQDLRVMVREERCTAASGMPHPYTVEVRLGDRSFSGCGGEPRKLLTGEAWRITSINGEAVIEGETPPTIRFTQADIGGSTGCNTYRAGYALTGEEITVNPAETTQMACSDELMAQEETFLSALDQVNRLRVEGEGSLNLEGEQASLQARRGASNTGANTGADGDAARPADGATEETPGG